MKKFDDPRSKGLHFRGGRITIIRAAPQPNDHHNHATAIIDITYDVQALQVLDRNGKAVESDPAHPHVTDRVWMRWTGTRWTVVDWKLLMVKK
jgi:predicted lipid-binding transport protein (Tim44 family)